MALQVIEIKSTQTLIENMVGRLSITWDPLIVKIKTQLKQTTSPHEYQLILTMCMAS